MSRFFSSFKYSVLISIFLIFLTAANSSAGLFDLKKDSSKNEVGADSPDFKGDNFLTEEKINFKDLKGKKVILLDFWSIYCVSCLKEIPKLIEIYEKFKDRDIYFIGVDLDTNTRRLKMFLKDPKKVTPYPIIMDNTREIANKFNVNILPTTIIIDKEGKIKLFHEGYKPGDEKHIEEIIDKLSK